MSVEEQKAPRPEPESVTELLERIVSGLDEVDTALLHFKEGLEDIIYSVRQLAKALKEGKESKRCC